MPLLRNWRKKLVTKRDDKRVPVLRFKGFTDEWEQRKLGDVAKIVGGGTPSTNISNYWNGNINWYSPTEIGNQIFVNSSKKKITELGLKESSAKLLPGKKTILFTSRAGIGDMAIMKTDGSTNQGFQSWIVKPDITDIYFLYSLGGNLKKQALRKASGSTFLEISNSEVKKLSLYLPDFEEQTIIGKIIKLIDKLITLQQRKLELLKAIKKAEIQQISKQKLIIKDEVNNKYVSINIGKTFKVTRGNVLSKENISPCKTNSNPYPVYSSQTKNDGLLGYFDRYLFENAITWTTDGANAGTVKFRRGKFFSTNVSGVLISNNGYANEINAEILNSVTYKYVSHVGNPKLMNNVMKDINITIPSTKSLQNKFSNFLLNLKINVNKQVEKIQNYKFIKQFLLQNMFI